MGQLIGLAILFCVVVGVCSKLFGTKTQRLPENRSGNEEALRAAYRQGFTDGVKHSESQNRLHGLPSLPGGTDFPNSNTLNSQQKGNRDA
ncbi:hypothetical protein L1281_000475 [Neisseria sp. HSC-16F19]|nr:hypothetical protein [Neisseria sp. HSC-16F19]MCP2039896.1 hypothetical protein [Neisseria sp. HSC-16F19]